MLSQYCHHFVGKYDIKASEVTNNILSCLKLLTAEAM